MPNVITDRPALIVGLLRAALALVVAFWPSLFTPAQQEVIIGLAVAMLAFTGVTVAMTVPKTPSVDAPKNAIQKKQPKT